MGGRQEPTGEIVLYQTDDGQTRVECRFAEETLWLTQALMADLFQTTPQNITLHLKTLYAEGEIDDAATCKEYLQVRREGAREVRRSVLRLRQPANRRILPDDPEQAPLRRG